MVSIHPLSNRNKASAATFLISTLLWNRTQISTSRFPQAPVCRCLPQKVRNHIKASWSLQIGSIWPSKCGRDNTTVQNTAKLTRSVLLLFCSAALRSVSQHLTGFLAHSDSSCTQAHPILLSHLLHQRSSVLFCLYCKSLCWNLLVL